MSENPPSQSLHPNIARLAAAYDQVIEQMHAGHLTGAQARAKIEQLESRDDQGVRWSIDPDTGQFVRKTLMGDSQYDTPPVAGYQTPDAYSYSATAGNGTDPNLRLEMHAVLSQPPKNLAGATRNGPGDGPAPTAAAGLVSAWTQIPPAGRILALVAAAVLLLALLLG